MKKPYFVLIILAIIFVTVGVYYFGTQKTSPVEVANNETVAPTLIPTVTIIPTVIPTTTPTTDETATLKVAIKKALVAKHGENANQLKITVSKIEGNYAKGGASVPNEGGGMWFSAKVNGIWQLVWDGNGIILCSDLTAYPNFPASMIPECYNDKTDKLVKR